MTDPLTLISDLEAADEGSRLLRRLLDARVCVAAQPKGAEFWIDPKQPAGVVSIGSHNSFEARHYTTSIDAALSLFDPGQWGEVLAQAPYDLWQKDGYVDAKKLAARIVILKLEHEELAALKVKAIHEDAQAMEAGNG